MNWLREIFTSLKRLFFWFVTILPWEQGIRVRLGKHRKELQPGIHLAIPFIDQIFSQNIRMHVNDFPNQTLTTIDNKTITLSVTVAYSISSMLELYQSVENPGNAVLSTAMGEIAQFISTNNMERCKPREIENHVTEKLEKLPWGLKFHFVKITDFAVTKTYRIISDNNNRFWSSIDLNKSRTGPPNE